MNLNNTESVLHGFSAMLRENLVPAAATDAGCERELNEDRYAAIESRSGLLWMVCDGMGGVTGGELAAQLAIDAMRRNLEMLPARLPAVALKSAVVDANRGICLRRQNPSFSSMGTTLVAILLNGPEIALASIGDSRAYLVHGSSIQQLTTDDTYVQELVERGDITQEEALAHPQAHILTKAIGANPSLDLAVMRRWIIAGGETRENDVVVLCTDGLYTLVSDAEIAACVKANTPQSACTELVALARTRGGFDNITVAVLPLGGVLSSLPPAGFDEQALVRHPVPANQGLAEGLGIGQLLLWTIAITALATILAVVVVLYQLFG